MIIDAIVRNTDDENAKNADIRKIADTKKNESLNESRLPQENLTVNPNDNNDKAAELSASTENVIGKHTDNTMNANKYVDICAWEAYYAKFDDIQAADTKPDNSKPNDNGMNDGTPSDIKQDNSKSDDSGMNDGITKTIKVNDSKQDDSKSTDEKSSESRTNDINLENVKPEDVKPENPKNTKSGKKKTKSRSKSKDKDKAEEKQPVKFNFLSELRDYAMAERKKRLLRKYPIKRVDKDENMEFYAIPQELYQNPKANTCEMEEIVCIRLYDDPYVQMTIDFNLDANVKKPHKKSSII